MRYFYTILFYLVLPIIFLRLLWRSRHAPDYRFRLSERVGIYPIKLDRCIWIHAVSMGETIAAIPLIKKLKEHYQDIPILVTTMTPTGAAKVKATFGDQVHHAYLPYDVPTAVNRFLDSMHPMVGLIMETELWPNLLAACKKRNIPVCLLNARLSQKSSNGYQRIPSIAREMMQNLNMIAAHGLPDAQRFIGLGAKADQVVVTGSIKFDLEIPQNLLDQAKALRSALGEDRFIWIAASTHEGEEEIILAAHQVIYAEDPKALLILVPRHPERFAAIADLSRRSFITARRSLEEPCVAETAVYLGDTLGELLMLYAVADVAFVGGSLIERGGHNILEPGALGKAILSGPHLFNFNEISELFFESQALVKVTDTKTLVAQLQYLKQDTEARMSMGERASALVAANRGALAKQVSIAEQFISIRCRI